MPFPTPHEASEFRWGLPYLLSTLFSILHGVSRVRHVGLKQDDLGGAFLCVPSTLCGSPAVHRVVQVYLCPPYESWMITLRGSTLMTRI
jgi:hypothetical protein